MGEVFVQVSQCRVKHPLSHQKYVRISVLPCMLMPAQMCTLVGCFGLWNKTFGIHKSDSTISATGWSSLHRMEWKLCDIISQNGHPASQTRWIVHAHRIKKYIYYTFTSYCMYLYTFALVFWALIRTMPKLKIYSTWYQVTNLQLYLSLHVYYHVNKHCLNSHHMYLYICRGVVSCN